HVTAPGSVSGMTADDASALLVVEEAGHRPQRPAGLGGGVRAPLTPGGLRCASLAATTAGSADLLAGVLGSFLVGLAGSPGLELAQLALEVGLQAAAVFAFERPQRLQLTLQVGTLGLELAEHLGATLLDLLLDRLRPLASILLDLGSLRLGLGIDLLRARLRLAHQPICFGLGIGDELVSCLLRQGENLGGSVAGLPTCCSSRRTRAGSRGRRSLRRLGGLGWTCLLDRLGRCGSAATASHGAELVAKLVVLTLHARELGLDLVQELVDLLHVVTLAQADGRELLV